MGPYDRGMARISTVALLLFVYALVGCSGESEELDVYRKRVPPMRDTWEPASLGLLAWWTADQRFVTLDSSALVTNWKSRIDGGGVLRQVTPGVSDPAWTSSARSGRPGLAFGSQDALDATSASLITALAGTNKPFSILVTLQFDPSPGNALNPIFQLMNTSGTAEIQLLSASGDQCLTITRTDNAGSTSDITGSTELGTSIRRLGATFDGTNKYLYVDAVQDASTNAAALGASTFDRLRVPDDVTGGGLDGTLYDVVVVPRAISRAEWLHYYGWSVAQWGKIQPPTFGTVGTSVDGTGTLNVPYPTVAAGDRVFTVVGLRNADPSSYPVTPGGWTLVYGPDENPTTTLFVYELTSAASGSETGTVAWTMLGTNNCELAFMFTLKGVSRTKTPNGAFESATTTEVDGPGSLSAPTIRPNGYGRLAVAVTAINEEVVLGFTGASGGTWSRMASATSSVGSNFGLAVHVAPLPADTPISGGSATLSGSDAAICRAFAVVGE